MYVAKRILFPSTPYSATFPLHQAPPGVTPKHKNRSKAPALPHVAQKQNEKEKKKIVTESNTECFLKNSELCQSQVLNRMSPRSGTSDLMYPIIAKF